eukprot:m.50315 g.50315  ORF g.50315 m.50315 type:complete len:288 (-) comp21258_c0_seq1:93-956(-)
MEPFNWDSTDMQLWNFDLETTKIKTPASVRNVVPEDSGSSADHHSEILQDCDGDTLAHLSEVSTDQLQEDMRSSEHYQEFCDTFSHHCDVAVVPFDAVALRVASTKQVAEFLTKHGMLKLTEVNNSSTPYTQQLWDIKQSYLEAIASIKRIADDRAGALGVTRDRSQGISKPTTSPSPKSVLDHARDREMLLIAKEYQQRQQHIESVTTAVVGKLRQECRPTRKRRNLPPRATKVLTDWYDHHHQHPYPSDPQKLVLANEADVKVSQVNNWFSNRRNRKWIKDEGSQ